MINKKTAAVLIVSISLIIAAIASFATFYITRSLPNAKGELYVTAEQYNTYLKYNKIEKVQEIVKDSFYKEVDADGLVEGALKGMVASLQDPYSVYYTKEEYREYNERISGKYTGIGVEIRLSETDGLAVVTRVFANSPAKEAGMQVGDKLLSANGEKLSGLDLESVANKIIGPEGTYVTLVYIRDGKEITKEIIRRPVDAERVQVKMLDNNIGQIILSQFNGSCVEEFKKALRYLKDKNAKGVIVDLRNNPGGRLSDVCDILDVLLPSGVTVYTQDREGKKETYNSGAAYDDIPMAVLVNGYSASASEVFAGAVQDYKRADIVGTKTFGKGIVQNIIPITETGAAVKITTSHYYTPNGRDINGMGIMPDYIVEQDNTGADKQLQKALEVLYAKIN